MTLPANDEHQAIRPLCANEMEAVSGGIWNITYPRMPIPVHVTWNMTAILQTLGRGHQIH